jgi:hypothetical protein
LIIQIIFGEQYRSYSSALYTSATPWFHCTDMMHVPYWWSKILAWIVNLRYLALPVRCVWIHTHTHTRLYVIITQYAIIMLKILGATVQFFFARAIRHPEFLQPWNIGSAVN